MKNQIIILLLFISFNAFSQGRKYQYTGRYTPAIKKEKLIEANFITEIMPEFKRYFILPWEEKKIFDEQLKQSNQLTANYIYSPELYNHPVEDYNKILYFSAIEISGICHGKNVTAQSVNNILTEEQKDILKSIDLGEDLKIKIRFKFKNIAIISADDLCKMRTGEYDVTVIPATEAECLGGYKSMTEYLRANIFNKISDKKLKGKVTLATVKFAIDDKGQITETKMVQTSTDAKIDKLILDAITKMPKWKPAKNVNGITVKQIFTIPFGGGGC